MWPCPPTVTARATACTAAARVAKAIPAWAAIALAWATLASPPPLRPAAPEPVFVVVLRPGGPAGTSPSLAGLVPAFFYARALGGIATRPALQIWPWPTGCAQCACLAYFCYFRPSPALPNLACVAPYLCTARKILFIFLAIQSHGGPACSAICLPVRPHANKHLCTRAVRSSCKHECIRTKHSFKNNNLRDKSN